MDDYIAALDVVGRGASWKTVPLVLIAAAASWLAYVPVHELAHAFGCVLAGGEVTRLEIDAIYGAALLQKVFPFVVVGSEYAGQLTGFDTGGSDLVYLATDFAPFLFTIGLGVPLLRRVADLDGGVRAALLLGCAIPVAYAPLISISGDYYEMGSILVSRLAAAVVGVPLGRWRSDDLFALVEHLRSSDGALLDWVAVGTATLVGVVLALATYSAGAALATALRALMREDSKLSGADTSE